MPLTHKILNGLTLLIIFVGCGQEKSTAPEISQMEKWGGGLGLSSPESVVFDAQNHCLYVSNGKQFAPGTEGFISKFHKNGKLEQLKWVDSLSRPTGMAIHNNRLWVADVNALKVIDISTREVVKSYPEPIKNSGLNDVAINPGGEVYVTASFIHSVFKVEGDSLKTWIQDAEQLQWANGILATKEEVIVGGTQLSGIDIQTKTIRNLPTDPPIKDVDGLWPDGQGGFLISTVEGTGLWHLDTAGKSSLLSQGGDYLGDLQYLPETRTLYLPRGDHEAKRYYLAVFGLKFP
ncbi:hypothetical protein [Flagellimonas flava]|uniref:Sugar lactone lactonase YvrE n=1 Tax=Flagellimonas flava TaxID=570519 RepID=A0A1M5K797_9FLAO|nr:hypothetical protein [Allomuricauda flava]SHG48666.1 hypothetical protein SAMN04488116_1421 [Allomuricauda flava]